MRWRLLAVSIESEAHMGSRSTAPTGSDRAVSDPDLSLRRTPTMCLLGCSGTSVVVAVPTALRWAVGSFASELPNYT